MEIGEVDIYIVEKKNFNSFIIKRAQSLKDINFQNQLVHEVNGKKLIILSSLSSKEKILFFSGRLFFVIYSVLVKITGKIVKILTIICTGCLGIFCLIILKVVWFQLYPLAFEFIDNSEIKKNCFIFLKKLISKETILSGALFIPIPQISKNLLIKEDQCDKKMFVTAFFNAWQCHGNSLIYLNYLTIKYLENNEKK